MPFLSTRSPRCREPPSGVTLAIGSSAETLFCALAFFASLAWIAAPPLPGPAAKAGAANATPVISAAPPRVRVRRRKLVCDKKAALLFRVPTGLADGLALKELR